VFGTPSAWAVYLHHETYYDFVLHVVMAFAAMAMWSESQIDRMRDLSSLAHLAEWQRYALGIREQAD